MTQPKSLIFNKELVGLILKANSEKKAKDLARKISNNCREWIERSIEQGEGLGKRKIQEEIKLLLNIIEE